MNPYSQETLAILTHIKEMLLAFTFLDDVSDADLEDLKDEAQLKAELIWESMGGVVTGRGTGAGLIHVELELRDVEPFLTRKANELYVEDVEV